MAETLALKGGEPVRKEFLSLSKPYVNEECIYEVMDTLRSGWLTTGPRAEKLEEGIKNYIGCKNVIAVNSGTSALLLAIEAIGIKPGDEVITTPVTWPASAHVIEHYGGKPIFVDVEKDSYNIDTSKIPEKITSKTKAILPVHLAGRLCEMDAIMDIAKKNNLFVIEDAAHALEGIYKKKKIGTIADITCFSMYATKNLFVGEGGLITTENDQLADRMRMSRIFGMGKDSWKRYMQANFKPYDVHFLGHKCNLSDVHAAIALHQLDKIEKRWEIRKVLFNKYNELLADIPQITLPKNSPEHYKNAYHMYSILINIEKLNCDRNEFVAAMQAENIGIGIHFLSLHLLTYYREKYNFKRGDFPNAEFYSDRTISIPFSPFLSLQDLEDVAKAVRKVANHYKR